MDKGKKGQHGADVAMLVGATRALRLAGPFRVRCTPVPQNRLRIVGGSVVPGACSPRLNHCENGRLESSVEWPSSRLPDFGMHTNANRITEHHGYAPIVQSLV